MPWKSKKQERWGHSPAGLKALGGKDAVAEWDAAPPKRKPKKSAPVLREADFRSVQKKT